MLEMGQSALKVYTSLKVAKAGPKAAKKVAKAARGGDDGGVARVGRFVAIPAALVGAGVLVKRLTMTGAPVTESPPRGFPPPSTPPSRPDASPSMGEPGAPKSGTSTASPTSPPSPGGGDGGGGGTTPGTPPTP